MYHLFDLLNICLSCCPACDNITIRHLCQSRHRCCRLAAFPGHVQCLAHYFQIDALIQEIFFLARHLLLRTSFEQYVYLSSVSLIEAGDSFLTERRRTTRPIMTGLVQFYNQLVHSRYLIHFHLFSFIRGQTVTFRHKVVLRYSDQVSIPPLSY